MKKPDNFFDLPCLLQESLLWDMNLDYCPYESSKAEVIHLINVSPQENIHSYNKEIIENSYKNMTEEFLFARAQSVLQHEKAKVNNLETFVHG